MSEVDQIAFDNDQTQCLTANFGTLIDQKPSKYFIDDVTVTFKLLISKRMRPIIPQMLWTGASVAYWSGLLTPINSKFLHHENRHIHEDEVLEKCQLALAFFGFGSSISAIIMGRIIDYTSSRKAIVVNMLIMVVTAIVSIYNIDNGYFGTISHLTAFVWGLQDGIVNTHIFQILGYEFNR